MKFIHDFHTTAAGNFRVKVETIIGDDKNLSIGLQAGENVLENSRDSFHVFFLGLF
jgi:hypothetical protein